MEFSRHTCFSLPLSCALAVSAPAASGANAQEVPQGCAKCHAEKKILAGVAKMPAAERDMRLDAFPAEFFATDAKERKTIVEGLKK